MSVLENLKAEISAAVVSLFDQEINKGQLILNPTNKEFEGDFTFVVFPLVKQLKRNPVEIGEMLGSHLIEDSKLLKNFNVVKGFLNLELNDLSWVQMMNEINIDLERKTDKIGKKVLVEFSSPNTNKPLHLGHIRNILLGWSMAQIADANGWDVVKTQIVNDRGIAICKGMLAWQRTANGATPESSGIKGDHFVGNYYVEFEKMFQEEYKAWQTSDDAQSICQTESKEGEDSTDFFKRYKNTYFNTISKIGADTKEMLIKWESGDPEVRALWKQMNDWVYEGFNKTYNDMGVNFDILYYESETYLLGKEAIKSGLEENVFYKKEDGSIWADLEPEGMNQKIMLRSDGTSVYMTQDIGTAIKRNEEHNLDSMIYVVGDEQNYHFKALFAILNKMGEPYADQLHHLSYGMVELPSGKMKSREGTVVDADDLMAEVIQEARSSAMERGGLEGLTEEEREKIYRQIGLAALKYFMIRINPKKWMTFDPKESVDMQGTTGPYIQNAYVRIQSILRKAGDKAIEKTSQFKGTLNAFEKELIQQMNDYPNVVQEAFDKYDPSLVANYAYALAKSFHRFYHESRILSAENEETIQFRLLLSSTVAKTIKRAMALLGIEMPEYM